MNAGQELDGVNERIPDSVMIFGTNQIQKEADIYSNKQEIHYLKRLRLLIKK